MSDMWGEPTKGSSWISMLDPMKWAAGAPCSQTDADLFHPDPGHTGVVAKRICWGGCDVRETCLQYALDNDIDTGVWGGTNGRDRWKLKNGIPVDLEPPVVKVRERKPEPILKCRWCTSMFQGHWSSKYCSIECRDTASAARRRRDAA